MLQIKKRVMCIISAVSLCASAFPYTALANDYFVINTIAGEGGSVSPKYSTEVPYGESLTVTMTPDFNYEVSDVIVDGKSVGDVDSYTFQFITSDHTLKAEFEKTKKYTSSNSSGSSTTQQTPTVTTPTVDSNKIFHIITSTTGRGKIDPAGNASVNGGGSVTFNIVPETGYEISEVYIDDVYVGKISSYTFSNVAKDHTLSARFVKSSGDGSSSSSSGSSSGSSSQSMSIPEFSFNVDNVENPYTDITSSDSYYRSALNLYKNDVLLGTLQNQFSPSEPLTRDVAARAFWRMERIVSAKFSNPYSDVSESNAYRDMISWSYHMGIISPASEGVFNPSGSITREQLCQMIYNYAVYKGIASGGTLNTNLNFSDADQISSDCRSGVVYCTVNKIIGSTGTLNPKGVVSRGEAAQILNNAMIFTRQAAGEPA